MNYIEIKEKYPKAFDALAGWIPARPPLSGDVDVSISPVDNKLVWFDACHQIPGDFNDRDLYDFFDQNRILVNARYDYIRSDDAHFDAEILDQATGVETYSTGWLTRPEAETAGFMKAFEILEERINKQKQ